MSMASESRRQGPSRRSGDQLRPYAGESYYGRPPLKPSPWNWTVSGYIFLAGVAGAAQAIAAIARSVDRRAYQGVVRTSRHLGTFGSAAGAALLIVDLKTPQRWYNMLRIFRPTSPMSFGSYILGMFGALSGVTLLGEMLRGRGRLGRAAETAADTAQVGAAVAGAGAATYTAALLASTSSPYLTAAPRHLGALFAASSVATAAAALSLGEQLRDRPDTSRRLDDLAAVATAAHLAVGVLADRHRSARGIPEEVGAGGPGRMKSTSRLILAGALPLGAYMLGRMSGGSRGLSILGSLSLLAGGYLLRHATLEFGKQSATTPEAHFRFAQPRNLPSGAVEAVAPTDDRPRPAP